MPQPPLEDIVRSLQSLILTIGPDGEPKSLKENAEKALEKVRANNLDSEFHAAIAAIKSEKNLSPNIYAARQTVLQILHDVGMSGYGPDLEN